MLFEMKSLDYIYFEKENSFWTFHSVGIKLSKIKVGNKCLNNSERLSRLLSYVTETFVYCYISLN
jgi:hypothetical protein